MKKYILLFIVAGLCTTVFVKSGLPFSPRGSKPAQIKEEISALPVLEMEWIKPSSIAYDSQVRRALSDHSLSVLLTKNPDLAQ